MALLTGAELAENLEIAYVAPDAAVLDDVALAASDLIGYLITAAAVIAEPAACKQATMSVGVEIFQARTAAGGEVSRWTSRQGLTAYPCGSLSE
jgi:hypothetical protein